MRSNISGILTRVVSFLSSPVARLVNFPSRRTRRDSGAAVMVRSSGYDVTYEVSILVSKPSKILPMNSSETCIAVMLR